MTQGENPEQESSYEQIRRLLNSSMSSTSKTRIRLPPKVMKRISQEKDSSDFTFSEVVDKACEGLRERQIKYSIQRIQKMQETIRVLEQELDFFLEEQK